MEIIDLNEEFVPAGSGVERSKASETGLIHLTDVIKFIDKKLEINDYSSVKWDMSVTAEVGFLWEQVLEDAFGSAFGGRVGIRPGEIELDGIVGSPDGVNEDPLGRYPIVDEEYKCTWKSTKNNILDHWYYMTQFKSYCKMLGVCVTVVKIIYLMGDYRGSGPIYKAYRIEFTERELEENWSMIRNHAEEMRSKGIWKVSI